MAWINQLVDTNNQPLSAELKNALVRSLTVNEDKTFTFVFSTLNGDVTAITKAEDHSAWEAAKTKITVGTAVDLSGNSPIEKASTGNGKATPPRGPRESAQVPYESSL